MFEFVSAKLATFATMASSARGNFSFDESRLEAIERGNSHLLTRLHEIATRPVSSARASASAGSARVSSARASSSHTINRKKRDAGSYAKELSWNLAAPLLMHHYLISLLALVILAEIERQNMLLLRRLQGAKPTVSKTGASAPKSRAAAGGAGAAAAAAAGLSPFATGPGGRPAWIDPLSARPALESLGSTAASMGGAGTAAAAGGAGYTARSEGGGSGAGGAYAVGKPLSPEKLASTRRSVFGRASMGGTARVGGRMTGVPPARGAFGEVDPRDLMLSACREDHLTRGR